MKEKDGISVVIPVYNASRYLRRVIDSVLAQTYKDFELILVDDGSKDDSLDICNEYKKRDDRIIVISKENGGTSSARNVGIENASRKYIAFLDNDDYVLPHWLETMHQYAELSGGCDLLMADSFHISEDKFSVNMELLKEDGRQNIEVLEYKGLEQIKRNFPIIEQRNKCWVIWNLLFLRDIIVNNDIRYKKITAEDEIFCMEYLMHVNSIRTIFNYRAYCTLLRKDSQSSFVSYRVNVADIDRLMEPFEKLANRLCLKENYLVQSRLIYFLVDSLRKLYGNQNNSRKQRIQGLGIIRKSVRKLDFKKIPIHQRMVFTLIKFGFFSISDLLLMFKYKKM